MNSATIVIAATVGEIAISGSRSNPAADPHVPDATGMYPTPNAVAIARARIGRPVFSGVVIRQERVRAALRGAHDARARAAIVQAAPIAAEQGRDEPETGRNDERHPDEGTDDRASQIEWPAVGLGDDLDAPQPPAERPAAERKSHEGGTGLPAAGC